MNLSGLDIKATCNISIVETVDDLGLSFYHEFKYLALESCRPNRDVSNLALFLALAWRLFEVS